MNKERISTESKVGVKTKKFSKSNSVNWNMRRRFK